MFLATVRRVLGCAHARLFDIPFLGELGGTVSLALTEHRVVPDRERPNLLPDCTTKIIIAKITHCNLALVKRNCYKMNTF
jgi:hypothetical protein